VRLVVDSESVSERDRITSNGKCNTEDGRGLRFNPPDS